MAAAHDASEQGKAAMLAPSSSSSSSGALAPHAQGQDRLFHGPLLVTFMAQKILITILSLHLLICA
jgi:hypothetical protein